MVNRNNVVNELKTLLSFYKELGFEYLPVRVAGNAGELSGPKPAYGPEGDDAPQQVASEAGGYTADKSSALENLRSEIGDCIRCKLSKGRRNIVFGEGNPDAGLMFIGEGPGRDEDIQARPFVGEAGKLLTNLIIKLKLKREDVYIGNIIKCRPPYNRNPEEDEIRTCRSFIEEQINIVRPKVIVCLGAIAAHALLRIKSPISKIRGIFLEFRGIPVMPTFHPAYLLRNPKDKWLTWEDMQKVLEKLK